MKLSLQTMRLRNLIFRQHNVIEYKSPGDSLNIDDFYHLEKYKDELMILEGYGEKSIQNLLDEIKTSKEKSLENLFFALGIRLVGMKTAMILSRKFLNILNKVIRTL